MKKTNLLTRVEMKNVMGGAITPIFDGCTSDEQCSGGRECCPNMTDPSQPWTCETPILQELPNGTKEVMCPGFGG